MGKNLQQYSRRYFLQSSIITLLLAAVTLGGAAVVGTMQMMLAPVIVSASFVVVSSLLIAQLWRWVAENDKEMLTTFYSAVPGFRMLAGLAVLTVCYFCVGRDAMMPYGVTFIGFYFVELIHHTYYFSRLLKSNID